MTLFLRRNIAVTTLALALISCGKEQEAPAAQIPDVSLGNSARALAENRTVRVTPWQGGKTLAPVEIDPRADGPVAGLEDPLGPSGSPDGRVGLLEALASGCEYIRDGYQRPDIQRSYAQEGQAYVDPQCELRTWVDSLSGLGMPDPDSERPSDPTVPGAHPSLYSYPGLFSGGLRGGIAKCIADELMLLAEAVQPTYINGGKLAYIGGRNPTTAKDIWFPSSEQTKVSPLFREELSRVHSVSSDAWPAEKVLYTVVVPSSSDAATWALLAVDYYRLAMFESAIRLQCPTRQEYGWRIGGQLFTADARYESELRDSVDGMEAAADLARRKISAAADERLAKATDKASAVAQNWTSQFNSRLEAVRAYLPMPPKMFDGWRVTPLVQVVARAPATPYGDYPAGNRPEVPWLSTDPYRWADYGFPVRPTQCFVHPPDGPQPRGTRPLITTLLDNGTARLYVGAQEGARKLPSSYDALNPLEFRLEGYIETESAHGANVPLWSCGVLNTADVKFISHCGQCPAGEAGTIVGYAFGAYPTRTQLTGEFPVTTAVRQSPDESIAEHLLRTTRVDPRLAGSGNAQDDINTLIGTVARAYDADTTGLLGELVSGSTVDVDGVLALFGTSREAFVNAANRVSQQALALGRGITPDPTSTGAIPRVLGTEERQDSAEAAYYMALAERSSHLARVMRGEALSSEIVNDSDENLYHFALQHAQHGIRHAEASLLSTLEEPTFRLRSGNRLQGSVLELLRARLRNDIEGWAAVYVNVGARDGASEATFVQAGPENLMLLLRDYQPGTAEALQTYEIWIGEAGLDCALGKVDCDPTQYRFGADLAGQEGANKVHLVFPSVGDSCGIPPQAARFRLGTNGCRLRFDPELRIYVTRRDASGKRKALFGFTADGLHPVVMRPLAPEGSNFLVSPFFTIPFLGVREETEITETVAPDPEVPTEGETPCTRTTKLVLEEELMEASTGKDDIESSFNYYLGVATEAAERADRLGEEMIRAGLTVDERSEVAREKLEELCGGVVNLERVLDLAASQGKDIATLLTDQEFGEGGAMVPVELLADLTALRNCIGIGPENGPANVAVGNQHLCYWQFDPPGTDPNAGIKLPPCVAPVASDAPNGEIESPPTTHACPVRMTSCDQGTYGLSGDSQYRVRTTDVKLGVSTGLQIPSSISDSGAMISSVHKLACVHEELRLLLRDRPSNNQTPTEAERLAVHDRCDYDPSDLAWVQEPIFRSVGERLGVRLEPFYAAVITLDGKEWIRFAWPESGFALTPDEWPCAPHPSLSQEDAYACALHDDDLLCGVDCQDFESEPASWLAAQERLVESVAVIKTIGGASFDNFDTYSLSEVVPPDGKGIWAHPVGFGSMPTWLRSLDLKGTVVQRRVASFVEPIPITLIGDTASFDRSEQGIGYSFTSGAWYRSSADGGDVSVWCAPVLADGSTAVEHLCAGTRSHGAQPKPMHGYFDATFNNNSRYSDFDYQFMAPNPLGQLLEVESEPEDVDTAIVGSQYGYSHSSVGSSVSLHGEHGLSPVVVLSMIAAATSQTGGRPGCGTVLASTPTIRGPEDFPRLSAMLECAGQTVEGLVRDMMLVGIPRHVAEVASQPAGVQNVVPSLRGKMGEAVGGLTGWLESYVGATTTVSRAIRDVAVDFDKAAAQLSINESEEDLAGYGMLSRISSAAAACAAKVSEAASAGFFSGKGGSALAVCADAAVQMAVAIKSNDAELDKLGEQRRLVLLNLAESITNRMDSIDDARRALGEAHANVMSTLAQVDSVRNEAKREVSKALGLESDEYGRVFPVTAVTRARYNTAKVRYERALFQAQEAAYLARRAFEQRVGRDLSEIHDDMALVQAPSKWVNSVCATTGLNYERIRKGNTTDEADPANSSAGDLTYTGSDEYDYADGFIGDYVTNLRRVRDSWGTDFPFQDGDDLVVLSLRDDLLQVTNTCDVEGVNELLQTAHSLNDLPGADGKITEVWQSTCSSDACATALTDPSQPLICYVRDAELGLIPDPSCAVGSDFPDFGDAAHTPTAVRLHAGAPPEPTEVDAPDAPETPPQTDLELWYRADRCSLVSVTQINCPDLSGHADRPSNSHASLAGSSQELLSRGIGGQPTLRVRDAGLWTPPVGERSQTFTVAAVYRVQGDNQLLLMSTGETLPDGTAPSGSLTVNHNASQTRFLWNRDGGTGDSGVVAANTPLAKALEPEDGAIITLVVDGDRIKLYSNGRLLAADQQALPALRLGSLIARADNGHEAQWAEYIAYSEALDENRIAELHRYLSARYGIALDGPRWWIDGQDLARMRDNGGRSAASGYVDGSPATLFDRATGKSGVVLGTGENQVSLRALSTGRAGFTPNGSAMVSSQEVAYMRHTAGGGHDWSYHSPLMPDATITMVAQADTVASLQALMGSTFSNAVPTARAIVLAGGTVAIQRHQPGLGVTNYAATAGQGQVTQGVPFVVTLRTRYGDGTTGSVELFLNGLLAASAAVPATVQQTAVTSYPVLQGVIGEFRSYARALSNEDILAEHAQLASKYGLPAGADAADVGLTPSYRQRVQVPPGTYSLSWYQRADEARLQVLTSGATEFTFQGTYTSDDAASEVGAKFLNPEWVRHYGELRVDDLNAFYVGWVVPESPGGIAFAAPQLESTSAFLPVPVQPFASTDSDMSAPRAFCEDKNGEAFRRTAFRRGYETTCNSDNNENCNKLGEQGLLERTYFREISFDIAQEAIDQGKLFARGGFAKGNFNYRHKTVSVNIVGTGVKKCENSQFPSSCYGSNFLQYSIRHEGPFEVRNHEGEMYDAPLFMGRIQQGKALMAERYLSNPMSSADRSLISDFTSGQLWGRPLDGGYTLRVYDADGLDWDAVEDVQIVLDYRFWTRQQ